jgi:hypothetical protein
MIFKKNQGVHHKSLWRIGRVMEQNGGALTVFVRESFPLQTWKVEGVEIWDPVEIQRKKFGQ